jgi:transposase InsO family protein
MGMSYTSNPRIERVRMEAARLVQKGYSTVEVARHFGYSQSAIVKWAHRARLLPQNAHLIPTRSSRPRHHPHELSYEIVSAILNYRAQRNQCAEILYHRLLDDGYQVSLSSVKRVLRRFNCSRYSRWKKWHQYPPRPLPERPGILVEIDSVHEGVPSERLSAFALLDVHSRWGYVEPTLRTTSHSATRFVHRAKAAAPFPLQTIQTDHGSEFSKWFTKVVEYQGVSHLHSRVRTPTDNAHVERFIQTLQKECLHRIPRNLCSWQKEIPEFLKYYNTERPHMALNYQTPLQYLKLFQAID